MKTAEHRSQDLQDSRPGAAVDACIHALFRRCPGLCGFSVRDPELLLLVDVSAYPSSGPNAPRALCEEIAATLIALIDECPEAGELLRERTFARVLH